MSHKDVSNNQKYKNVKVVDFPSLAQLLDHNRDKISATLGVFTTVLNLKDVQKQKLLSSHGLEAFIRSETFYTEAVTEEKTDFLRYLEEVESRDKMVYLSALIVMIKETLESR